MAVFTETIKLDDQVSAAAKASASAVKELGSGLAAAEKNLVKFSALGDQAGYSKALVSVGKYKAAIAKIPPAKALVNAADEKAGLDALGKSAPALKDLTEAKKQAVTPTEDLGEAHKKLGKSTFDAANAIQVGKETIGAAMAGIHEAFSALASGDVKGAVQGLVDGIAGIAKALDLVVPGLGEAVSAVISVAGGFASLTVGLIQSGMAFALSSAQSKAAMISMFDALGQGKVSGEELDDMLTEMSSNIGIAKDSLAPLTKAFLQMGVTGKDQLEQLTLAAISANAIVGEGGAAAFESLTKKIQAAAQTGGKIKLDAKFIRSLDDAGVSVNDVAKALGTTGDKLSGASVDAAKLGDGLAKALIEKGAGPLGRLSSSLGEVKKKFMSDLGDLFEGIDFKPFMDALKSLFGIFESGEKTGKASGFALKEGITGFFQATFDIATQLVPIVKNFLLDLIIYGLKAYIAIVPIVKKLEEWYAKAQQLGIIKVILGIVEGALIAVAVVIGVLVLAWLLVVGAAVAFSVILYGTIAAITLFGAVLIDSIVKGIMVTVAYVEGLATSIWNALGGLATMALQAGGDFINGLIQGITSGAAAVGDAAKSVASGAVSAVTGFLGIKSPSTVMAEIGGHTAMGFAGGIGDAANDVHGASTGMAQAAAGGASNAAGGGGGGRGGASINVTIYIEGAGKSAEELTTEMVSSVFEQYALAQGA